MSIIKNFTVKNGYITLGQFLKEEGIISSGGEAKIYLKNKHVVLNGQRENERGKKLRAGDKLMVADQLYEFR